MLKYFLKESILKTIIDKISSDLNKNLLQFESRQDQKFDQILDHLERLRFDMAALDQKMISKELKDKTDYGHMKYKISSLQDELNKKN